MAANGKYVQATDSSDSEHGEFPNSNNSVRSDVLS